ncbi:related to metallophosphoesterase domain-containing 2 [Lecanosticta acicola]|uniref:Related to metallophosphoesterase domain-containing 2 n=1 Tax=Lecanosticta acicola TaxID=111012 RepID=A0AAI9EA80_9PEZI|nr:related to metallophosphoesterase domain-containing 2 [Lecanosticta acicola]
MAESTIRTRILIISDTHCARLDDAEGRNPATPPFKAPLPKADLLIHAGDLTYKGKMPEYHATLDMLKQIDAPLKLVIAGNHDLTLDRDFVFNHTVSDDRRAEQRAREEVEEARALWTAEDGRAKLEGITYLNEGVHQIALNNGANLTLYASPYTPEFCDWGFPYERDEDRYNPPLRMLSDAVNIAPYPVPSFTSAVQPIDILLTHGPPYARLDKTKTGDLAGCPHLLRAAMRSRPLLHCFGHIHEGWGADRVTWSNRADQVTDTGCSITEWKTGAWKEGVADHGIKSEAPDLTAARERHAAFLDVSLESGHGLKRGEETLMINASIMDVGYQPVNAPWVVDIDLPRTP